MAISGVGGGIRNGARRSRRGDNRIVLIERSIDAAKLSFWNGQVSCLGMRNLAIIQKD